MAIKMKLESLDGVEENVKALYKKTEGGYLLDVEDPDREVLLRAKEHEKNLRQIAENKAREAAEKLGELAQEVETLKNSSGDAGKVREELTLAYTAKLNELSGKKDKEISERDALLRDVFVNSVAKAVSSEVFVAPALGLPHVAKRLKMEIVDGKPQTVVLDANGKESAMTLDELKAELLANPEYAGATIGSKASGGGAAGGGRGGASKKWNDMAEAERTELYRRNPSEYRRLRDEAKAVQK